MKTVILGATGAIGNTVAPTLLERGFEVRVVGRKEKHLREMFPDHPVEYVTADLARKEDCAQAIDGMDAAIYTVGLPYSKKAFAHYPVMMERLLHAAANSSLEHLLLISNVYPYGIPQSDTVDENHPRQPASVKGRYRKEQEDLVLTAHNDNGLKTISLRLPDFYGPGVETSIANNIFDAAVNNKPANLLGPIDTPHEFVYVPDVGPVVADLLSTPQAFGTAYNFAGAGHLSFREFTEKAFAAAGRGTPSFRVIQGFPLRVFGLVSRMLRELVEMEYLLKTPVLLDDQKLHRILPDVQKTSYEDGIKATLAAWQRKTTNGV